MPSDEHQTVPMTSTNPYAGMTMNERLHASGRLEAFDVATKAGDRAAIINILNEVGIGNAAWTADAILEDPARYGY